MVARTSGRPYFSQITRDLIFVVLLGVASIALGLLVNALRPQPMPIIPVEPDVALSQSVGEPFAADIAAPAYVDIERAMQVHNDGSVLFVDARPKEFFDLVHIAGAVSLPRSTFANAYPGFAKITPKDRPLMIYCSESKCVDSTVVARALLRLGYTRVQIFQGGWDEWDAAGQPTDAGGFSHE